MLSRDNQVNEESRGLLDYLSMDIVIILCQHFDPVSLLSVSLSNHEFNFLAKTNWVWSPKLKQAYPDNASQQNISLEFSEDNTQIMHYHSGKSAFRLFSRISAEVYAGLSPDETKCFMLVRANDLDAIKANKINFNFELLKKKDAKNNLLIDLIVRNKNPGLNEYVFECLNYNIANIKDFLRYGVILNQESDLFFTWLIAERAFNIVIHDEPLLFTAAKYNSLQSAQLLLDNGASVEKASKENLKPLHIAAQYGHLDMVKLLVTYHAGLDEVNGDGYTAVMIAAKQGKYEVVKYLYECGAKIHGRLPDRAAALYFAMRDGHTNIADFLLQHDENMLANGRTQLSPLFVGVRYGHFDAMSLLLNYLKTNNIQIDIVDNQGDCSVYTCAEYNYPELCQLLLEHGLSIEGSNVIKDSPLNCAINKGHHQVVEVLCLNKPDFNRMLPDGGTALYSAVKKNNIPMVKLLCKQGGDVINIDCICINQYTPLCRAAMSGYTEIAETLISYGANVKYKTHNQTSPLYLAASGAHVDIMKLLISHGADVNDLGPNDMAPLHAICNSRHTLDRVIIIIQALIKAGANPLPCSLLQLKPPQVARDDRVAKIMEKLEFMAAAMTNRNFNYHSNISLEKKLDEVNINVFTSDIFIQECKLERFKYLFDNISSHFGKAVLILAYLNMDTKDQLSKSLVTALGFQYTFKARNALQVMLRSCLGNDNALYDLLLQLVVNPVSVNVEYHMLDATLPANHIFAAELTCLNYVENYLNKKILAMQPDNIATDNLNNTHSELLKLPFKSV